MSELALLHTMRTRTTGELCVRAEIRDALHDAVHRVLPVSSRTAADLGLQIEA